MNLLMASHRDEDAIEAVIFDMDGVVTNTMRAHFESWKAVFDAYLRRRAEDTGSKTAAFTIDDYYDHVDGMPRYDGVRAFLQSRQINLPEGAEDDDSLNTIRGIGNRKNQRFHAWLAKNKVATYDDALDLIRSLKKIGLKVGVFSSSRNAERVLKNADVLDIFDAKVDGIDAQRLDLAGKPDPAILLELTKRLGSEPSRTVVVEDAVSGVRAGTGGRFRLVIGVDREQKRKAQHGLDLRANGADLVTRDLRRLVRHDDFTFKLIDRLASVWNCLDDVEERIGNRKLAVFLDYDGTLTPIVADYRQANLSQEMTETLRKLAEHCPVAIISGRDLQDIRNRVQIQGVFYAGSHGFDIGGPDAFRERPGGGDRFLTALDAAEKTVRSEIDSIHGASVERKTFAIAVHFRQAAEKDVQAIEQAVERVVASHKELRKGRGKKVFQIQPRTEWDKGHAVQWLLAHTPLGAGNPLPVYIGDDLTDEDAFEALADDGISIIVRDDSRESVRATAAEYALEDPRDVGRFLDWLSTKAKEPAQ